MNLKPADDYQTVPRSALRKMSMEESDIHHRTISNHDEEF